MSLKKRFISWRLSVARRRVKEIKDDISALRLSEDEARNKNPEAVPWIRDVITHQLVALDEAIQSRGFWAWCCEGEEK